MARFEQTLTALGDDAWIDSCRPATTTASLLSSASLPWTAMRRCEQGERRAGDEFSRVDRERGACGIAGTAGTPWAMRSPVGLHQVDSGRLFSIAFRRRSDHLGSGRPSGRERGGRGQWWHSLLVHERVGSLARGSLGPWADGVLGKQNARQGRDQLPNPLRGG